MAKLNREESELLEAFESGTLKLVGSKRSLEMYKTAAKNTAVKDKRINIRLTGADLQQIQVKALQEGLPYQTLIASVLHKYAAGVLTDVAPSASKSRPA